MVFQPILDLVQLCAQKGITEVVLSPGSRNAPLSLAFARHGKFNIRVIVDERSAAFMALGSAQQLQKPVILVCTSGTATLNYGPAIAEAFFSKIPLLVLTADRPVEWIGQQDGQAIYQQGIFGKHALLSLQWPADWSSPDSHWYANRTANEAIQLLFEANKGPVQINIPFREPFYPEANEAFVFNQVKEVSVLAPEFKLSANQMHDAIQHFLKAEKVLVVVGQHEPDLELSNALYALNYYSEIPVVADVTANVFGLEKVIKLHDWFLMDRSADIVQELQPDLLITCGRSVLSKYLKQFLRSSNPIQHWHIQEAGEVADSFQSLTHIFRCEPAFFLKKLGEQVFFSKNEAAANYGKLWEAKETEAKEKLAPVLKTESEAELFVVHQLLQQFPAEAVIHVGNSMPIRYVNLLQTHLKSSQTLFVNRGTSGIDGSVSTAVGAAWHTSKPVYLLLGDLSFFYDKNGLWHNYLPANFKVVILNNSGGNIFRMIEGPSQQNELEQIFETTHTNTSKAIADHFGIAYFNDSKGGLKEILHRFISHTGIAILELFTDKVENSKYFAELKSLFK